MKCPNCNETLLIAERHKVEIDYCPSCRGVWLDRGELDKLLLFAEANNGGNPSYEDRSNNRGNDDRYASDRSGYRYEDRRDDRYDDRTYGHKKKKKSFLSDLFDFD